MHRSILYISLLFLLSCVSPTESPDNACYHSNHFTLYYYEHEYSISEITAIAARKERLLAAIANRLEVDYDSMITCYLFLRPYVKAWTDYQGIIFEPKAYLSDDPGHEIVHAVILGTLGATNNIFLAEGLAEALQLNFISITEQFVAYCQDSTNTPLVNTPIADAFTHNIFDYSTYAYLRAGSFVTFLIDRSGIANVKKLYEASPYTSEGITTADFTSIFGISPSKAESLFNRQFFSSNSTSLLSKEDFEP